MEMESKQVQVMMAIETQMEREVMLVIDAKMRMEVVLIVEEAELIAIMHQHIMDVIAVREQTGEGPSGSHHTETWRAVL